VSTGKILVTGATGFLGGTTLRLLLDQVPAERLAGLARDPARAAGLAEKGVEIRQGDYFDYESLEKAFAGAERLMLVATHAFTDRNAQHFNAITAAARAGVRHIVFTTIQRNDDLDIRQIGVTDSDIFAEQALAASGLTYTVLRHPIFLEQLGAYIGADAYETGVRVPPGDGTVAPALRRDLAAANVAVLTQDGHENKTYTLTGSEPASFRDIAGALTEIHGSPVPYVPIGAEEYIDGFVRQGFPREIAEFLHSWTRGVNLGQFSESTGDLERLIGYRPTSYREFFAEHHPAIIPGQADPQAS
jgi:NAD(P)H dehydrogenase (quinone)